MPELNVNAEVKYDATDGFSRVTGLHETNQRRLANLWIDQNAAGFSLTCTGDLFDGRRAWRADIPISDAELVGAVQQCLVTWHEVAVGSGNVCSLYQARWDFSADETPFQAALPKLALAGYKLFRSIFYPQKPGASPEKIKKLNDVGEFLAGKTREGEQWLRVTSNSFNAPWNLIYSEDPIRSPIDKKNFWGYRHLIEHAPEESTLALEMKDVPPLLTSFCLDQRIDVKTGVPLTKDVIAVFDRFEQTDHRQLTDKNGFCKALSGETVADHVFYFWCHGKGSGDKSELQLTPFQLCLSDDEPITPADIAAFMGDQEFAHRPLVFLNVCQGGKETSLFYRGFGDVFLNKKASAVIGPYTDIPIVFAGEFAKRFFAAFLEGRPMCPQTGRILLDLRREFIDTYNNPLGLLYSLYWGADIFLRQPLPRKQPTP